MKNEILKINTELSKDTEADVFTDFSLPALVNPLVRKKTDGIIKRFFDINALAGVLGKLKGKHLEIQIPAEFQEKLKNGTAHLGKKDMEGCFTTTIYEPGKRGSAGQLYVKETVDPNAMSDALSNLAVYGMLQQISNNLEEIKENQRIMLEGQRTDRLGTIIGSFRAYVISYPLFKTEEEKRSASFNVFKTMSQGITQIHFELDTLSKELKDAPDNAWSHFLKAALTNINYAGKKEQAYDCLVYGLYKYYNMLKLSDIILLDMDANAEILADNHRSIEAFCMRVFNEDMDKKVKYLNGGDIKDYLDIQNNILSYVDNVKENLIPSFKKTYNLDLNVTGDHLLELTNN